MIERELTAELSSRPLAPQHAAELLARCRDSLLAQSGADVGHGAVDVSAIGTCDDGIVAGFFVIGEAGAVTLWAVELDFHSAVSPQPNGISERGGVES